MYVLYSPVDVSNFDAEFTAEPPMDSYKEGPQLSQTVQDQFYGKLFAPLAMYMC
jgi:hypothetical protein